CGDFRSDGCVPFSHQSDISLPRSTDLSGSDLDVADRTGTLYPGFRINVLVVPYRYHLVRQFAQLFYISVFRGLDVLAAPPRNRSLLHISDPETLPKFYHHSSSLGHPHFPDDHSRRFYDGSWDMDVHRLF